MVKKKCKNLGLEIVAGLTPPLTQNYFFSLSQKFVTKKVGCFCHFLKKLAFLVKFDMKSDSLTHFHSRNVYFYIHNYNSSKVPALDMFLKKLGSHPP